MKTHSLLLLVLAVGFTNAQGLTNEQFEIDSETRTDLKYIPAGYDGSNSLPLLMNFHVGSDDGNNQLDLARDAERQ
jgi:hypothetical protein